MNLTATKTILKETFSEWSNDKAPKLAASLAFYTMLALAPLLVLVTGIMGLVFGDEAARGQVVEQFDHLIGKQGAEAVQTMIQNASQGNGEIWATIFGGIMLVFGATAVFVELQDSMNTIWGVKPKQSGLKGLIKGRLASLTLIIGVGFLLMVSLVLSAALAGVAKYMGHLLPGMDFLWQALHFAVSIGVLTLLFAMIFKVLPDAKVPWREVWVGAGVTALLFTIGKFAIGFYLGQSSAVSVHGAAGSLAIVLLWVYYAAQILFLGAEFTQVHAHHYGSRIEPAASAVKIETRQEVVDEGRPAVRRA
ncbi:MAG TPA: YihY/virulence factor BrkB family protein [Bdellovibrionales bacterium]|nr:YihY/virulence factor BrkB family protein [Bdellovibrionales bacterium]